MNFLWMFFPPPRARKRVTPKDVEGGEKQSARAAVESELQDVLLDLQQR